MSDMSEQKVAFSNEEKVIVNHLKMNLGAQIFIFLTYLFAATCSDWSHIKAETQILVDEVPTNATYVYHFTLVTMKVGTEYNNFDISQSDFDWIGDVSQECNEVHPDGQEPYPEQVCKRARSLHLAGIFVSF